MGVNYDALMLKAIALAEKGRGFTHPNPLVGAIIVNDAGEILSEGYHKKAGENHAEINALEALGKKGVSASGKTMIVSLEPCNHTGKTPPCTEKIIAAKIKKVVVGTRDTNPYVKGGGIERLKNAGIEVIYPVQKQKCRLLNRGYFTRNERKRPWVIAKWAMTLDGKIATRTRDSKWITSEASRKIARRLRAEAGAVLVGVGTAITDDPQLNYREADGRIEPVRILLDPKDVAPKNLRLFNSAGGKVIVVKIRNNIAPKTFIIPQIIRTADEKLPEIVEFTIPEPYARNKIIPLNELLEFFANATEIDTVLVEGGMKTLTAFFEANLVDEANVFIASKIVGGAEALMPIAGKGAEKIKDAFALKNLQFEIIDSTDVFISGIINFP